MSNYTIRMKLNEYLEDPKNRGRWRSTKSVCQIATGSYEEHTAVRNHLQRLRRLDKIERRGEGKFYWRVKEKQDQPKVDDGVNPIDALIKAGFQFGLKGDTYKVKNELRNIGLKWAPEHKAWVTSNFDKWLQGAKLDEDLVPVIIEPDGKIVEGKFIDGLEDLENIDVEKASDAMKDAMDQLKGDHDKDATKDNGASDVVVSQLLARVDQLEKELKELDEAKVTELIIETPAIPKMKVEKHVHPIFEKVMFHIACGDNVMLVGPKGCGKTYLAGDIAETMKLDFGMQSLSGGVMEGKLLGRNAINVTDGTYTYHPAPFSHLFSKGGLFLLDEVDAADPNVLLALNSALANREIALEGGKEGEYTMKAASNFYCISAANTWGNGADRQYVGRNAQDGAFIERFHQIEMDYDPRLELSLCPGNETMVKKLQGYRDNIRKGRMERTISTRIIERAHNWMKHGKDLEYVENEIFAGWRVDEVKTAKG